MRTTIFWRPTRINISTATWRPTTKNTQEKRTIMIDLKSSITISAWYNKLTLKIEAMNWSSINLQTLLGRSSRKDICKNPEEILGLIRPWNNPTKNQLRMIEGMRLTGLSKARLLKSKIKVSVDHAMLFLQLELLNLHWK